MKFETINSCLLSMIDGYSPNEALIDATNANKQSKEALEKLFDSVLWVGEDFEFANETDEAYYIALGQIEQVLVAEGLIYND